MKSTYQNAGCALGVGPVALRRCVVIRAVCRPRRVPPCLIGAIGRTAFGWLLDRVDWHHRRGRLAVRLVFRRSSPRWMIANDGRRVIPLRVYDAIPWSARVRLAWFLVWTCQRRFKIDHGDK